MHDNAKWKVQSDILLKKLALHQIPLIPQLFHIIQEVKLILLEVKIVDDLKGTGLPNFVEKFLNGFGSRF